MLNLSQIQFFLDAVELSSIHKVAEKNNISPQGASKSIKSLESELGVQLIERSTKGVVLTEIGTKLKPYFENIAVNQHEIKNIVDSECQNDCLCGVSTSAISGEISLVVTPRFANSYLSGVLHSFKKTYPKVRLKIDTMSNDKIFGCMKRDTFAFDLAIVTIANIVEWGVKEVSQHFMDEGLQFISYCTKELYVCGRKEVIKKYGDVFDVSKPVDIVAYENGGIMDNNCYPFVFKVDSISAQKDFINQSDTVGAYSLDEFATHFNAKKYAHIPMSKPTTLTYGIIMRQSVKITEAEKAFLQTVYDYFVETEH